MLTEEFVTATQSIRPQPAHTSTALKDVGVFVYEFQPQTAIRHGYKKSSSLPNCVAVSDNHIFAAQAEKAVVNVYSRTKSNQEATVPFPQKITSLAYLEKAAILVLGTQDGRLLLWETATGRMSTSAAAHLEAVTMFAVSKFDNCILSASPDSNIHIWHVSDLVSFHTSYGPFNHETALDSPNATFAQHRMPVSALGVGRSHPTTNIAVSASVDKTCFVWHIQSCQVLRTVLLVDIPRCLCFDVADRAIYIGSENGGIQQINIISGPPNAMSTVTTVENTPTTLNVSDIWKLPPGDIGAAQSITISHDGTNVVSGHFGGHIIRWDVAKRRVTSEMGNILQSVTTVHMLIPPVMQSDNPPFIIPTVTKPRLELDALGHKGSTGLPADYSAQLQVTRDSRNLEKADPYSAIDGAIIGNGFDQSMIDDAVQAMLHKSASKANQSSSNEADEVLSGAQLRHFEKLEEELVSVKARLATQEHSIQKSYERHLERMKKRDTLGHEKRQAFFAAKKAGQNGDEAMKPFANQELALDVESDEDAMELQ